MPGYLLTSLILGVACVLLATVLLTIGKKSGVSPWLPFTMGSFIFRELPNVVKPNFVKPITWLLHIGLCLIIVTVFASIWHFGKL